MNELESDRKYKDLMAKKSNKLFHIADQNQNRYLLTTIGDPLLCWNSSFK